MAKIKKLIADIPCCIADCDNLIPQGRVDMGYRYCCDCDQRHGISEHQRLHDLQHKYTSVARHKQANDIVRADSAHREVRQYNPKQTERWR